MILGSQGREWQGRFGARCKHHMTVRRRVLQKIRDRLMDSRSAEPVIVFEKQVYIIFYLCKIVDEARQDRFLVDNVVITIVPDCAVPNARPPLVHITSSMHYNTLF